MWVHSNIIKSHKWTTVTNKKFRGKVKPSSCNMVSVSSIEIEEGVASLTDLEEEESALTVDQNAPPMSKI